MRLMINGQWQEHSEGLTMSGLIDKLGIEPRRVAVELNRRLLPRAQFAQTTLKNEDVLEIVTLVGGG